MLAQRTLTVRFPHGATTDSHPVAPAGLGKAEEPGMATGMLRKPREKQILWAASLVVAGAFQVVVEAAPRLCLAEICSSHCATGAHLPTRRLMPPLRHGRTLRSTTANGDAHNRECRRSRGLTTLGEVIADGSQALCACKAVGADSRRRARAGRRRASTAGTGRARLARTEGGRSSWACHSPRALVAAPNGIGSDRTANQPSNEKR